MDALPLAPELAAVTSKSGPVVSVTGSKTISVEERVMVVAVVVMELSNDASEAVNKEVSVSNNPAGPTNVSAHTPAVVPVKVQSRIAEVDSYASDA